MEIPEFTRSRSQEGGHGSPGGDKEERLSVYTCRESYPKAAGYSHITVRPSPSHGRGPASEWEEEEEGELPELPAAPEHPIIPECPTRGSASSPGACRAEGGLKVRAWDLCIPTIFMEEVPSLLWGLDPVFLAFAKLYIRDILQLKESHQVPGIFFYNGHPIKQVDILGTIVCVREKEAFYSYGDDSTGVINCTCWKSSGTKCVSSSEDQKSTSEAKDLDGLMRELYRQGCRQAKMEIGDIIRVRGYIKVFRNQREVVTSTYYKVDDPMLVVQISQMLDLPYLYRNVYDKPFIIPDHLKDPTQGLSHDAALSHSGFILQLSEKIKVFLEEKQISDFYQRELESVPSLLATATKPSCKTEEGSSVTSKEIHNLFKEAIHLLQEKGIVYLKGHKTGVYQVTDRDKELHKLALSIIQEDCRRQRHADKGCHLFHILNCVQHKHGSSINETILQRVIDTLERNSDIISTMEKYYTSF